MDRIAVQRYFGEGPLISVVAESFDADLSGCRITNERSVHCNLENVVPTLVDTGVTAPENRSV